MMCSNRNRYMLRAACVMTSQPPRHQKYGAGVRKVTVVGPFNDALNFVTFSKLDSNDLSAEVSLLYF